MSGRGARAVDCDGWASFLLLNLGLLLRLAGEPQAALGGDAGAILVASGIAQLLAGSAFIINTWPRVRER